MQLTLSAILLSLAAYSTAAVPRAFPFCAEASRFGDIRPEYDTVKPGQSLTVYTDFRCALRFGTHPKYIDYSIAVDTADDVTGLHIPVSIARREYSVEKDQFTITLPDAQWIPNANYSLVLQTTYPVTGPDGSVIYSEIGTMETYINIAV